MMNWAYIAGFFDGEGTIGVRGGYRAPSFQIAIGNTHLVTLERIKSFLASRRILSSIHPMRFKDKRGKYRKRRSAMWRLQIGRETNVREFFSGVLPYSVMKKPTVEDCLRTLKLFPVVGRWPKMGRWN